jgi:hypothetical protein
MAWTYDVFISYSQRDIGFAVDLERALSGLSVFRDRSTIEVGDVGFASIIDAIYSSRAVVILLSPDYISSHFCMGELYHATGRDPDGHVKIVLPVLLRPVQLPNVVRLIQYLDAGQGQDRDKILVALRSAVMDRLSTTTPPEVPRSIDEARLDLAAELRPDAKTLVRVLRMARRVLANLEVRAAGYTSATMPPTLEIELEDKRSEVAGLEERLRRTVGG